VAPRLGRRRQGLDPAECGVQVVGPGPVGRDVDPAVALAAGDPAGGVEQPVAQGLGFGLGQVAVQGQVAQPGEQVDGEGDDLAPGLVDAPQLAGQAA